MEFLAGSLLELITQTSTNLPPDVRAAMSIAAKDETPDTQSSQALDIILSNIDMASRRFGPDLPGHRHADVRRAHAGGREPDSHQESDSRGRRGSHAAAASCGPTPSIRSPAKTAATIWAKRRRSFISSSGKKTRSKSS